MITTKEQLRECIAYEKKMYSEYMFPTKARYILSRIKREPARMLLGFLIVSRKSDYYLNKKVSGGLLSKFNYIYYLRKRNILGQKLGLEISTNNIGKGFLIYHYNNVVNGNSIIGENCHLHGNNCIGNNGITNDSPVIGNNVLIGVGAKVIGGVTIANDIKIAAGAVVVHSFYEEGITIAGIPAKKINYEKA